MCPALRHTEYITLRVILTLLFILRTDSRIETVTYSFLYSVQAVSQHQGLICLVMVVLPELSLQPVNCSLLHLESLVQNII
jgi:hypothetical protein